MISSEALRQRFRAVSSTESARSDEHDAKSRNFSLRATEGFPALGEGQIACLEGLGSQAKTAAAIRTELAQRDIDRINSSGGAGWTNTSVP